LCFHTQTAFPIILATSPARASRKAV
jgi:hypothetical protein